MDIGPGITIGPGILFSLPAPSTTPTIDYLVVAGGGGGDRHGGGGAWQTASGPATPGGNGGGGAGAWDDSTITAGAANTGGGGGASRSNNTATIGRPGGSGVVIVRYPDSYEPATSTTGFPTISVSGGYRYYVFTGSGSITI